MFQIAYIISLTDQARRHDVTHPVAILATVSIAQTSESVTPRRLKIKEVLTCLSRKETNERTSPFMVLNSAFCLLFSVRLSVLPILAGVWFLDATQ